MFKKVRKIWSKTGSPKVHILTLKASLEPSFFGTPENRCVKRPRLRSMCPPLISRPQKSLKFRTDEGRTNERTNGHLFFFTHQRKGASRNERGCLLLPVANIFSDWADTDHHYSALCHCCPHRNTAKIEC